MPETIQIHGARVHNLRNISVELPLNRWTVVTGVSGSGKSSLAFDTLYAEGQRRYVESLSAYARQFLERMEKPDVDAIDGIAPAVAIRQKSSSRNPRSTVGTATEVYDYLRLLYARAGTPLCPDCGRVLEREDVDSVVARLYEQDAGRRCLVMFVVRPAAGATLAERLGELRGRGFTRLWQNGVTVEFSQPESLLELDLKQTVYVLVDRLRLEEEERARLVEALETACRESGGAELAYPDEPGRPHGRVAGRLECAHCGRVVEAPEPRLFSFNNPYGACPRCQGFGRSSEIARERVIPDPGRSLAQGAIEVWNSPRGARWRRALERWAPGAGVPLELPWRALTEEQRRRVWEGEGKFPGVRGFFQLLERKKYKVHVRVLLARYRGYTLCPDCGGARLRPEALAVVLPSSAAPAPGLNLAQLCALTVAQARVLLAGLRLSPGQAAIARPVLAEVERRLAFLDKVGLDYLTLDRLASTMSGGEAQRIQLAACLGGQLVGALYVLDEPSIGLHPRDTARLVTILKELRDLGNTIVVVEHDPEVMRAADRLVDLGPGAGEMGGRVVAEGTWEEVAAAPGSLTGQYLRGERSIPVPSQRRLPGREVLTVHDAHVHNLAHLDVEIPLRMLVALTGVSGSGKSTLLHAVLYRNLHRALHRGAPGGEDDDGPEYSGCAGITGLSQIHDVVLVDQSPIGRTPRSNPVTYMKAYDGIRELFARQPAARRRGLRAGHFSFNVPGGRCETCQGEGVVTVDMQFLADVELTCEECSGTRFQSHILEVEVKGRNIHQVLGMSVHAALDFFADQPRIVKPLRLLEEIGLGYLRLGQSATTLSGGEAQRLKLAAHLAQARASDRTLFLFDEPTTGLHFDDIAKLLAALRRLIEAGGSVVVIEHNLEVIKAADWILDLGPEAGAGGGRLVAEGPPEMIAEAEGSRTAPFLAAALAEKV